MLLRIEFENQLTEFEFAWEALRNGRDRCWLWAFQRATNADRDVPVIYRHVLNVRSIGIATIYVGEGDSLNGPKKYCLLHQYSHGGHGSSRVKVREYLETRKEPGWTEILRLSKPAMNFADTRERKFVQMTLIGLYYWQHRKFIEQGGEIPKFLNDPF